MELQNGRPADAAGRMDKEIRTYDFLDGLGVDYQSCLLYTSPSPRD